ncbi:guanine nucleotide exchange protein smcr8a isoform X3 [Phycodurus eques]|uniref:guanine nucleotide exchange protein smcr8a isoform X3 n=1 Tax=Phycodurus eques TaxID=693459 RepID=UPI002ACEDE09|nr:guanine nucleotide exchange protein smcr8a isoform X3 [Phycodurus eques]
MIGSPDVVAFTKEDDDGQLTPDPWAIPEEFSIPLHPPADSNPWAKTSYAKFTKDFILISEFSEQVGPQPLLTIPDDPKVCGTFDLNYFSLRIMSVDYQASFVGHPPGSGYPRLSFVEDSRVVLGDSKEGAFAYVHHLTLYDLEARGFVRPFCMAYVSVDERKIMLQFQELSVRFSKASECLKAGNRRAFAKELQRKLRDLEYTHSVLQREEGLRREAGPQCMYSAHAVEKANELANVEKSIYEHRDLLRQISSYPHRPRRDPQAVACQKCMRECEELFGKYSKLANPLSCTDGGEKEGNDVQGRNGHGSEREVGEEEYEHVKRRPSYTPQLIKAKSAKCFDKRLKTLQELCDNRFYEATVELLKETESSFRGDLCYLHTRRLDLALRKKNAQILVVNQEPQALLPLHDDYAVGSPFSENHTAGLLGDAVSHTSAEDGSDCTMSTSTGSDWTASPLSNEGKLTLRQKKKAGQGALRFVRQYPFAMQALWCLLSGRTLVVLGADEARVRRLVSALALFVPAPGKCGERVQAWLCCPFTLTDLYRWKLIGLQRVASPVGSSMLYSLSRYSRYISILDTDQKTLRSPPYRGELLANMADHRTYVRRGSTYFLHVQSILCRLVAKAFLFTFTHHLHLPVNITEGPDGVEARRRCFLQEQLGLGEDDSQIVLYLSQLITQHYLHTSDGRSPAAAPFNFNYTTSVLYKI